MLLAGLGLQLGPVAAIAEDQQRQAELVEGLHGQIDPLVGDQPAAGQVVVARLAAGRREALHVHRRVDDVAVAAVELLMRACTTRLMATK